MARRRLPILYERMNLPSPLRNNQEDFPMIEKTHCIIAAALLGLGLSACSEQTQDSASATADMAAEDIENAADTAGQAVEDAAQAAGEAADRAVAATDELGDKAEQKAAEVEASIHNETVDEAKAD